MSEISDERRRGIYDCLAAINRVLRATSGDRRAHAGAKKARDACVDLLSEDGRRSSRRRPARDLPGQTFIPGMEP